MKNHQENELPPKYYLDNFHSLLLFVEGKYGGLLNSSEKAFIQAFRKLSNDGQCLFLRFANRKGLFFRTDKLHYPEIGSLEQALEELLFRQFCVFPTAAHQPMAADFLAVFGKDELCSIYKILKPGQKGLSRLKKPELLALLLKESKWEELLAAAGTISPVIKHGYEQELEGLKFLYFGHLGGNMSEFVIRDLGMVRYEVPEESQLVARFQNRKEVDDMFTVSVAYQHFRELREEESAEKLYSWYLEWSARQNDLCEPAYLLFNKLTLKLARLLERLQQPYWALEVYERTEQAPARERRVRLLHKTGAGQEALELCSQMQADPQNADEVFFAKDYQARLLSKKRTKSTTRHLKEAETVAISSAYRYQVEKGVIHHLQERGGEAMYAENYLWRSLFGLVFWDIVFDLDAPVYHSPLQRAPSGLYLPQYMESRQGRMLERMDTLSDSQKLLTHVEAVYEAKWGFGNPLVGWHENTLPLVRAACLKITPACLKAVFMEMARNLKENSRGFPDLFSWTGNGYAFIEVKSPNDTLSAQQLFWLRYFKECGIEARVLKVEWVEESEMKWQFS
jgi:hypothetical protein